MTRVLVYDVGQGYLTALWSVGSFLGGFEHIVPARTWDEALAGLDKLDAVDVLQVWGHGLPGKPLIGDTHVDLTDLRKAIGGPGGLSPRSAYVWFRSCAVFAGAEGHAFARLATSVLERGIVAHTRIISWPWPLCQSGGHGLRPGEIPYWPTSEGFRDDGELQGSRPGASNTCLVTTMDPPAAWWQAR